MALLAFLLLKVEKKVLHLILSHLLEGLEIQKLVLPLDPNFCSCEGLVSIFQKPRFAKGGGKTLYPTPMKYIEQLQAGMGQFLYSVVLKHFCLFL